VTLRLPFEGERPTTRSTTASAGETQFPPRKLGAGIPRDLETICLTAMEKELERRYESAGELQADLERFLAYQPVQARERGSARSERRGGASLKKK